MLAGVRVHLDESQGLGCQGEGQGRQEGGQEAGGGCVGALDKEAIGLYWSQGWFCTCASTTFLALRTLPLAVVICQPPSTFSSEVAREGTTWWWDKQFASQP